MSDRNKNKKSLWDRCASLIRNFLSTPTQMPFRSDILDDHVSGTNYYPQTIVKDKHYFTVEINQLFLKDQSKLWVNLDPTVFVTTEFKYNKKKEAVPFVVGPTMIQNNKEKIPEGMIFLNTKVAGLHPYKGDDMALTVVLCQVQTGNTAKQVLKFVEAASGALDYATALSQYLKVADIVVEGIEDLMNIKQGITPLIGLRVEFRPEVKQDLQQSYYVLINAPENELKKEELWVKDDCLYKGKSLEDAKPFREADYVLYSIRVTETRDTEMLPFDPIWVRVQQQAMQPNKDTYERAKAEMLTLFQTMYLSPDMTKKHAIELKDERYEEMKALHKEAMEVREEEGLLTAKLKVKKLTKQVKEKIKSKGAEEETEIVANDENLKNAVDILKS